jgi:hypothetical protein
VKVFLSGRLAKIPVSTAIEAENLSGRLSKKWSQKMLNAKKKC